MTGRLVLVFGYYAPDGLTVVVLEATSSCCFVVTVGLACAHVLRALKPEAYADERFGAITVRDILTELEKPGRDPRPDFRAARLDEKVHGVKDL